MDPKTQVVIADRASRKRAGLVAAATIVFLSMQAVSRPYHGGGIETDLSARAVIWTVNVVLLLALLATGGGFRYGSSVRSLMNDEVAIGNRRTAVMVGYWVATAIALGLVAAPRLGTFTAREGAYLVVTVSLAAASITFSFLEYRAHRDG